MGNTTKLVVLSLLAAVLIGSAADITPGHTFSSGGIVTHTLLNDLGSGTINSTFYTGKAAVTDPTPASTLMLFYDTVAGAYRKITLDSIYADIFPEQTDLGGMATNDYFLVWDTSGGVMRKATLSASVLRNTELFSNQIVSNSPAITSSILLNGADGNYRSTLQSALTNSHLHAPYATLSQTASPVSGAETWIVYDGGTFTKTSLPGYITNALGILFPLAGGDLIPIVQTNTQFTYSKVTVDAIREYSTNGLSIPYRWTGSSFPINLGTTVTNNHGKSKMPISFGWNLVCTNAELGYAYGDEITFASVQNTLNRPGGTESASSNSLFAAVGSQDLAVNEKGSATVNGITHVNWNLKPWAIFAP